MIQQPPKRRAWRLLASVSLAALLAAGASSVRASLKETSSGISAYAFQPRIGTQGSFIQVAWNRPTAVPTSFVLGYTVWRADLTAPLQIVGGLLTDASRRFTDSDRTRTVTAYNGTPGDFNGAGAPTAIQNVPGVVAGFRYQYQVSAAYRNGLQDTDGDGQPDRGVSLMSGLSAPSKWVTALGNPVISTVNGDFPSTGNTVDLHHLTVEWQQAPGADTYVIWVSKSPSFRGKLVFSGGKTVPVDLGGPSSVSRTINAAKGKLKKAKRLFVAVGARRSGDPRPQPFGAIFSAPIEVHSETPPPNPPG